MQSDVWDLMILAVYDVLNHSVITDLDNGYCMYLDRY